MSPEQKGRNVTLIIRPDMHRHEPGELFVRIPQSYFGTKASSIANRNFVCMYCIWNVIQCVQWPVTGVTITDHQSRGIFISEPVSRSSSVTRTDGGHSPALHNIQTKISNICVEKIASKSDFSFTLAVFETVKVSFFVWLVSISC